MSIINTRTPGDVGLDVVPADHRQHGGAAGVPVARARRDDLAGRQTHPSAVVGAVWGCAGPQLSSSAQKIPHTFSSVSTSARIASDVPVERRPGAAAPTGDAGAVISEAAPPKAALST